MKIGIEKVKWNIIIKLKRFKHIIFSFYVKTNKTTKERKMMKEDEIWKINHHDIYGPI
jgi:acyl CoA:acetate/3-ketoacid CoA transferase alpha subunit